jgi:hypothetical protein
MLDSKLQDWSSRPESATAPVMEEAPSTQVPSRVVSNTALKSLSMLEASTSASALGAA